MCNYCTKYRILVAVLLFVICCTSFMVRVNFSVVIIDITTHRNLTIANDPDCHLIMPVPTNDSDRGSKGQEGLNPLMTGVVLGVYDLGYSFSFMLYKILGPALGPTLTIGYSMLVSAGLTALTFTAYNFNIAMLIALRLCLGFFAGSLIPLINILILQWSPVNERNRFGGVLFGCNVGIITTFPLSGFVMHKISTKWVTYMCGIFSVFWATVWLVFVRDEPEQHRCVSAEETRIIILQRHRYRLSLEYQSHGRIIPWREIMQSAPFRALFVLMWANTWIACFYMNYMPLYFHNLLGFDVMVASLLSSLPFVARVVFATVCLPIVRFFLFNPFVSKTTLRKAFTVFSHILPGVIELVLLFLVCSKTVNTIKVIVVFGLNGAVIGGGMLNTADLTPHYAGTVHAAMQTILCISGTLMSIVVGGLLMYFDNRLKGWTCVMALNAGWYLFGGIVYIIFGSGSVQHWDMHSMRHSILHGVVPEDEPSMD